MTSPLENLLDRLRSFALKQGLQILIEHPIDYGVQVVISDGRYEVPVNLYTTGRLVVGGKASPLRSRMQEWTAAHQAGGAERTWPGPRVEGSRRRSPNTEWREALLRRSPRPPRRRQRAREG